MNLLKKYSRFYSQIKKSKGVLIACRENTPFIKDANLRKEEIVFLNENEAQMLYNQYEIFSSPEMMIFKNGQLVDACLKMKENRSWENILKQYA